MARFGLKTPKETGLAEFFLQWEYLFHELLPVVGNAFGHSQLMGNRFFAFNLPSFSATVLRQESNTASRDAHVHHSHLFPADYNGYSRDYALTEAILIIFLKSSWSDQFHLNHSRTAQLTLGCHFLRTKAPINSPQDLHHRIQFTTAS
jgi:hypothetical protein